MRARNGVALALAGALGTGGCNVRGESGVRQCPPPEAGGAALTVHGMGKITGTASDAWTIGQRRGADGLFQRHVLAHWDGCDWQEVASPFDSTPGDHVLAVWANGSDVWLSGSELSLSSGHDYRRHCPPTGGRVFRRRDGQWQAIDRSSTGSRKVFEIWGSSGDDVWMLEHPCTAIGYEEAAVRRWNGRVVTDGGAPNGIRAQTLWGAGPRDVWVGGEGGVARWDGSAWRSFPIDERIQSIAGSGPSDVWAAGSGAVHRWNGRVWTELPGRTPLKPRRWGIGWLSGVPGGHVFGVDAEGNIYRSDRAALAVIGRFRSWMSGLPAASEWGPPFAGGRDDFMLFLGGKARRPTMRWSSGTWTVSAPELAGAEGEDVVALWADGAANVWAAVSFPLAPGNRAGEIRRWNGTAWERAATLGQFPKGFGGIAPDDVWLVGLGGASWHWDGKRWTTVPTGTTEHLFAVWGSGGKDVWAGGEGGTMLRWDGTAWRLWSTLNAIDTDVAALGGFGADCLFAAGWSRVARWDGRGWASAAEGDYAIGYGATGSLRGVWGSSPRDFWLVGTGGDVEPNPGNNLIRPLPTPFILHGDGKSWKRMKVAGGAPLSAITGTAANDVWTVGAKGTVLHWNGATWSPVPAGTDENLLAVAKAPDGSVWIGGEHGTLRRLRP